MGNIEIDDVQGEEPSKIFKPVYAAKLFEVFISKKMQKILKEFNKEFNKKPHNNSLNNLKEILI